MSGVVPATPILSVTLITLICPVFSISAVWQMVATCTHGLGVRTSSPSDIRSSLPILGNKVSFGTPASFRRILLRPTRLSRHQSLCGNYIENRTRKDSGVNAVFRRDDKRH